MVSCNNPAPPAEKPKATVIIADKLNEREFTKGIIGIQIFMLELDGTSTSNSDISTNSNSGGTEPSTITYPKWIEQEFGDVNSNDKRRMVHRPRRQFSKNQGEAHLTPPLT